MNTNVTASDIAKATGFSQSTVSRALNNPEVVSPRTRKIIVEAAKKMGYQPNVMARGLITGKSRMIGLITSDIKNPFYPEVIEKFASALREKGFYVLFINSASAEITDEDIRPLVEFKVEGVIVTAAQLSSDIVNRLKSYGINVVLFNRYIQNTKSRAVTCDNFRGGEAVADLLIRTGHRNIMFIAGKSNTSTSQDRQEGFTKQVTSVGLASPIIEQGEYSYERAYKVGLRLFQSDTFVDAIFCANDIMAMGVIDAAWQMGVKIPDEVSIVGFDDIEAASWHHYSLTTVRQPVDAMIQESIYRMMTNLEGIEDDPVLSLLPGQLVIRNSVKNTDPIQL